MKVCEPCALGKAMQKNVPKVSIREKSAHPGQLIYLDIANIKGRKNGPKPNARRHWRMMVDDRTGLSISKFYSTKNEMVQPTCVLWNKWRGQYGITVKRVRVDNAGENRSLEKAANGDSWKMNIDFGYTARYTPQQNSLVERRFATSTNRGKALMAAANLDEFHRYKVGYKAFETADQLDGLTVIELDGVKATRYKHFYGQDPKWFNYL